MHFPQGIDLNGVRPLRASFLHHSIARFMTDRVPTMLTKQYVAYSPPDGAPDLDNFWTAALWLASAAHHGNGLPWADAFDSVIQRITGRPAVERADAICEIFIEYKRHESPGLRALLNDDWHGAPDETL